MYNGRNIAKKRGGIGNGSSLQAPLQRKIQPLRKDAQMVKKDGVTDHEMMFQHTERLMMISHIEWCKVSFQPTVILI